MADSNTGAAVIGRIIIKGKIRLESPLLIGAGTGAFADERDIHVLRDKNDVPFIPGTSLCGALRDYSSVLGTMNDILFGYEKRKEGSQSLLTVSDIKLHGADVVSRDGVRIDTYAGIAIDGGKFDYEVIEKGAEGNLVLGAVLRECHREKLAEIKEAVIHLREKLESGISIGANTAKGFGRIRLTDTDSRFYHFDNKSDVKTWLTGYGTVSDTMSGVSGIPLNRDIDFTVHAEFSVESSIIVKDTEAARAAKSADGKRSIAAVSKKSGNDFVIPGSSIKGVLRKRALYVAEILSGSYEKADTFVASCMGNSAESADKVKSRFIVQESYFKDGVTEYEHARTRIDRLTGGTVRKALFTEKPLYRKNDGCRVLSIDYTVEKASDAEAGLALFLLRDLSTGRIAVGGGKSVGRGILQGLSAEITFKGNTYYIGENGSATADDRAALEKFAAEFASEMRGE